MADMYNPSPGTGASGKDSAEWATTHGKGNGGEWQESGLMGRVKERAAAQLSTQKERAIEGLGSAARAVRQSTQQLRDQHHETVAGYVEQAADQIERFSQRLREKEVGDLLEDAQRVARRQPALFVGGAFALGLIGARFLKSSHEEEQRGDDYRRGYVPGDSSRSGGRPTTGDRRHGLAAEYGASAWGSTAAGASPSGRSGAAGIGTSPGGGSGSRDTGGTSATVTGGNVGGDTSSGTATGGAGPSHTSPGRRSGSDTERS